MKSKLIHTDELGQRTFVIILAKGDEAMESLTQFSKDNMLGISHFTAIGAFSSSELGFYELEKRAYKKNSFDEQAEVLILSGDVTLNEDQYKVHAHVVIGLREGSARGGHLLKGLVNPTLEIMLTESPEYLYRSYDEKSGLNLIDPGEKSKMGRVTNV